MVNKAFPPIKTIPFSNELIERSNDISVTGKLGAEMKVYETALGMVGRMPLYTSTRLNQPDLLYTIEASEGLGPLIDEQLKGCTGKIVNVVGKLRVEPYVDKKTGAKRSSLVIEAEEMVVLNRAPGDQEQGQAPNNRESAASAGSNRPSSSPPPRISNQVSRPPPSSEGKAAASYPGAAGAGASPFPDKVTPEREVELWGLLSSDKGLFWDNSENGPMPKRNPKGPDFKHKKTGEALWISSRNAPDWAKVL